MSALSSSASFRGRSRSRSGPAKRRMVSRSRSASSRSSKNNLMRTWPLKASWHTNGNDPFPNKMSATLRYSQNISLNPTSILSVAHVFRAASIFDPDFTGVGHQPYGHDQYQNIFQFYRVVKSVITVTSASTGGNNVIGVAMRATPTVITDPEVIREVKGTRFTPLSNTSDPYKIQMTHLITEVDDESQSTAQFGTNPTQNNYFHVWAAPNGSADPAELALCVDIVYHVEMWEPLYLGGS